MKMDATTAEMLATCCTHIAIAGNISSMKFLHDGMDHPVSQQCRIYQLEEIRIRDGKTPYEPIERIQGLADRCDFPSDVKKK